MEVDDSAYAQLAAQDVLGKLPKDWPAKIVAANTWQVSQNYVHGHRAWCAHTRGTRDCGCMTRFSRPTGQERVAREAHFTHLCSTPSLGRLL